MSEPESIPYNLGAGFNCTYSLGPGNCPIHRDDPSAPLHDCDYGKPVVIVMPEGKPVVKIDHHEGKVHESTPRVMIDNEQD